ncbi:MAG: MmgE/PrpD family protein, partial [Gammaproteobacteria bacterium]|nr:MmgE/PrpD family protein [Gammaproteobacteria bacterium]
MNENAHNGPILGTFIEQGCTRVLAPEVINAARLCLADWLAVAIGARAEEAGRRVRASIAAGQPRDGATVLFGSPAPAQQAALANGTLAHCLDFDDTHISATVHTSAPVWAAVLALAESRGAHDAAMLSAFATGYEVAAHLGNGLGQPLTARGWHGTGVFGRLGCAAACASLLGLDTNAAQHALALAATQAGGLTASFGTMAKPFHAGKAAMDGMLSATLAEAGLEGQPAVLEPGGGLDRTLFQGDSFELNTVDMGNTEILNNSFKPYAACHLTHPAIDAARAMAIDPADVVAVRAYVNPVAKQITGSNTAPPDTPLAAKFDLGHCVALGLHGSSVSASEFRLPWTPEESLRRTARTVQVLAAPEMGYTAARLEVDTKDGSTRSQSIEVAKGHPGNPMDWNDMWQKFDALVTP